GSGQTTLVAGNGNSSLVAGSGNDTFQFTGNVGGNHIIDPPPLTQLPSYALDFSRFQGDINVDLTKSTAQLVSAATGLTLTLDNPQAINNFLGTTLADP